MLIFPNPPLPATSKKSLLNTLPAGAGGTSAPSNRMPNELSNATWHQPQRHLARRHNNYKPEAITIPH